MRCHCSSFQPCSTRAASYDGTPVCFSVRNVSPPFSTNVSVTSEKCPVDGVGDGWDDAHNGLTFDPVTHAPCLHNAVERHQILEDACDKCNIRTKCAKMVIDVSRPVTFPLKIENSPPTLASIFASL